jgi:hypothetical protein
MILSSGLVNCYLNSLGSFCNKDLEDLEGMPKEKRKEQCTKNEVTHFSLVNRKNRPELLDYTEIINSISTVLIMIQLLVFRRE